MRAKWAYVDVGSGVEHGPLAVVGQHGLGHDGYMPHSVIKKKKRKKERKKERKKKKKKKKKKRKKRKKEKRKKTER